MSSRFSQFITVFSSLACLTLSACAPGIEPIVLKPTQHADMDGWYHDEHAQALSAFLLSCESIAKRNDTTPIGKFQLAAPAKYWKPACFQAGLTAPKDAGAFFESAFTPFRVEFKDSEQGLFTGYYIPEIRGSRKRSGPYTVPVYRRPPDLEEGLPYYTRAEINAGELKGRGLELAWVDDPVGLFFIEIQGSGIINLNTGGQLAIGFDGKNNHEYVALGRVMQEEGLLEPGKVNLFTIKEWLYKHPAQARQVMEQNPSFVFFKELKDGRIRGGQGVGLTPMRSLAIDHRYIPYGMPVFLQTQLPATPYSFTHPFNQLMIAQDTGGAIKGGIRGDIFFGHGKAAEAQAGYMATQGSYVLLVPNEVAAHLGL